MKHYTSISPNWIATVLDEDGTIIARTLNPEAAIGRKAIPENWSRIVSSGEMSGAFMGRSQEGGSVLLTFSRSSTSGWTTVIGIPEASLQQRTNTSLMLIALAGALVATIAFALAWSAGRRIYASAARLTDAATALQEGRRVKAPVTEIEQFERLGKAMQTASEAIHEREARLTASLKELQQAHQRLSEEQAQKDRFIATLAHELRNPLAPIRTGVQLLARSLPRDQAETTLAIMDRQVSHMVRLIDDLLDLSRIARGKIALQPEVAPLQTILSISLEASTQLFQLGGQQLYVDLPAEPIWVNADRVRIAQVVTNLLSNAAKFTPRNGPVTVTAFKEGEHAVVSIRDSGIGVPPDQLKFIFEMFAQLKEDGEPGFGGLGLGLSIAEMLIQLHGGFIDAQSDGPGRGATFTIRLPACTPAGPAEPFNRNEQPTQAPRRILVVDDNVDAADMLASALRSAGHQVEIAYSGRRAIEVAETFPAHLILLDIGMATMDGYEVCRRLRALPQYTHAKIVAVTGWGAPSDRKKAREAGFDAHLTKPVDWKDLEEAIRSA